MVRLVPIEKDVIPIILVVLVNIHLLNDFLMFPGWVQGDSDCPFIPMVRLVPTENDVSSKMPSIKDTLIISPSGLSGYKRTLFVVTVAMQIFPTCFTLL